MGIKKTLLATLLIILSLFNIQNVSANVTFKDVSTSHPLYKEIYYLVDSGVINGYYENGKSLFKPFNSVSRAEVAKMVVVATGNSAKSISKSSFTDVNNAVMMGYIERAVELGYMSATSAGKFSPDVSIKRDEMSKVLAIAFKLDVESTKNLTIPYTDVSVNSPYYKYVAAIYYAGITNGIGNNKFGLANPVQRDSFATFVARANNDKFQLALPAKGAINLLDSDAIAQVKVTENNLNVRAKDNMSSEILGKVHTGTKLSTYGISGSWVKVSYNGIAAYISADYVEFLDTNGLVFDLKSSKVETVASDAALYRGPQESTKLITTIKAGQQIDVYGTSGIWSITDFNGVPGYILTSAIEVAVEPDETPIQIPVTQPNSTTIGRVTADSLNIRQSASASSAALGKLTTGDVVEVISITGWWANIKKGNITGYVHKTYLHLMNTSGSAVANRVIVLDPGHGGKDAGAVKGKVYEKNIVLDVTKRVKALLEEAGAKVILTRSNDTFIELADRPKVASNNYGEVFISIHANSVVSVSPLGTETFYNNVSSTNAKDEMKLARAINNEIVNNANMVDRGIKLGNLAVIRTLEMPAILLELGFLSNEKDLAKLTDDTYLQIFAQSIFNGIDSYYSYN